MTDYVQTYSCPQCGLKTSGRGHLCHPNNENAPFTCEYCKKETENPRHACSVMVENIEYICKKCGRLAVYDSLLCDPEPIDND